MPEIRCFSTGRIRPKRDERGLRRYLPGGWDDRTLPVNVVVVEHAAGLCLFDTGQAARPGRSAYLPGRHPFLRLARFELGPDDEAAPQLTRLGLDLMEVRWVVLSHLHIDHVGGLTAFTHAEVLVSRVEWERAQGLPGRLRGYLPSRWPSQLEPKLLDFDGEPFGPFAASHDVAGDGRLLVVPLPGHTPGHVGLLVRNGRATLSVGDAAASAAKLDALDPRVARFCRDERVVVVAAHETPSE